MLPATSSTNTRATAAQGGRACIVAEHVADTSRAAAYTAVCYVRAELHHRRRHDVYEKAYAKLIFDRSECLRTACYLHSVTLLDAASR